MYRRWGGTCVKCSAAATSVLPLVGVLFFGAFIVYIFVVSAVTLVVHLDQHPSYVPCLKLWN
jgi:uncharacterized membrane protein YccC